MSVLPEDFIRMWCEAARGGHSQTWVAKSLGLTTQAVASRKLQMLRRGIPLPKLRRHSISTEDARALIAIEMAKTDGGAL